MPYTHQSLFTYLKGGYANHLATNRIVQEILRFAEQKIFPVKSRMKIRSTGSKTQTF